MGGWRLWVEERQRLLQLEPKKRWRSVRGPVGAMILTLLRIGWSPKGPAVWQDCEKFAWKWSGELGDTEELFEQIHKHAMK